jgi:hypothetical protein
VWDLRAADWLTIAAIILGPILAVQAQKFVEGGREKRERRLKLFHTLMATRAARISVDHVQALNMIDIEFYGRRVLGSQRQSRAEKGVTNAWRNYGDHLNTPSATEQLPLWEVEGYKLFITLLYEMSKALGYAFDESQLRRNLYSPQGHAQLEKQAAAIRKGAEELLSGEKPLSVIVYSAPPDGDEVPADTETTSVSVAERSHQ